MTNRVFLPGGEWLYLRIYTGILCADELLTKWLSPLYESFLKTHLVGEMFFLRYMDADYHLRIRFHLPNNTDFGNALNVIFKSLQPYTDCHLIWKTEIGTYEREIERYSADYVESVEQIFSCDSYYTLQSLVMFQPEDRWKLSCRFVEHLFAALRYTIVEKTATMKIMQEQFRKEQRIDNNLFAHELNRRYRGLRKEIESTIANCPFDNHYEDLCKIITEDNITGISKCVCDVIHMINNRIFISFPRQNEAVLYYYLYKTYSSLLARDHE